MRGARRAEAALLPLPALRRLAPHLQARALSSRMFACAERLRAASSASAARLARAHAWRGQSGRERRARRWWCACTCACDVRHSRHSACSRNGNEFAKVFRYFTVDGAIWRVSASQTALKLDWNLRTVKYRPKLLQVLPLVANKRRQEPFTVKYHKKFSDSLPLEESEPCEGCARKRKGRGRRKGAATMMRCRNESKKNRGRVNRLYLDFCYIYLFSESR